jgi:ribosome-associated protein
MASVKDMLPQLAQAIYDKKGFNILILDARACASLADYFIIAEGRSDRHVRAISNALIDAMNALGIPPWAIEGQKHGDWVAVDYGELIVHLFGPNQREHYSLEELWRESTIVDVPLSLGPNSGTASTSSTP